MILGLLLFVLFAGLASVGAGLATYAWGLRKAAPWVALLTLSGFVALGFLVLRILPS